MKVLFVKNLLGRKERQRETDRERDVNWREWRGPASMSRRNFKPDARLPRLVVGLSFVKRIPRPCGPSVPPDDPVEDDHDDRVLCVWALGLAQHSFVGAGTDKG